MVAGGRKGYRECKSTKEYTKLTDVKQNCVVI